MSEKTRALGAIIAIWALMLITVCFRYFARRISKAGFWYDDWLIVPATVSLLRPVQRVNYVDCPGAQLKLISLPAPCYRDMRCGWLLE